MYGYIYKVTNHINKKIYIGKKSSSVFIPEYFGSGLLIKRAIEKYGLENFTVEKIDTAKTLEELNEKEKFHIKKNRSFYKYGLGYNIASGGDGGNLIHGWDNIRYKEHINSCRIRNSGKNNPNYGNGKKISGDNNPSKRDEVRSRLKLTSSGERNGMYGVKGKDHPMYGNPHSKETRKKISESLRGSNHPNYGKEHSEETRRKMSQSQKGRKFTESHKANLRGRIVSEETRKLLSESRKRKRYDCQCKLCNKKFQGRAWNSSKCDDCKGNTEVS